MELYNTNFENTILSSILFNPVLIEDIELKIDDFYLPTHQNIFNAMLMLNKADKPIDEEFIKKELLKENSFDEKVLLDILTANPISNLEPYIEEIKTLYKRRQLHLLSSKIKEAARDENKSVDYFICDVIEQLSNDNLKSSPISFQKSSTIEAISPSFFLKEILPIQKNEITMLSAGGGTGKSYFALYILLELSAGLNVAGYFSEDSIGIIKNRIEKLQEIHPHLKNVSVDILGKELRAKPFIKKEKYNNLELSDFFFQFKNACKNYDVILLDPLITFIQDDENSNSEARFLMNLLNEWIEKEDKTLILIHHHSKNNESRGASAFIDAVRLHYKIEKDEEREDTRVAKLDKCNHYTGQKEFKVKLFKKQINVEYEDGVQYSETNKARSVMEFI